MPEPSLSELSQTPQDIAPAPVIDNSNIVDTLNQNARFNAQNAWDKYKAFLENKKDLFKNIGDIQGLEVASEDKPLLQRQAGDILKKIMDNPSIALGGRGYDEVQSEISKFKSNSMLSKQNKLDYDANQLFLNRNPDLYTDENVAAQENFLKDKLGTRRTVMLQMPTIFDEKGAIEGVIKSATNPYTAIVDKNGQPGEGYIESGSEVNPQAIQRLWNMALKGDKDKYNHSIMGAVKGNYNKLPDAEKAKYEAQGGGGIEQYFADRGKQYLDAYFPESIYKKTKEGNIRFGKKLVADPNYLGLEKLDFDKYKFAEEMKFKWKEFGLKEAQFDKVNKEDLAGAFSIINQVGEGMKNGIKVNVYNTGDKKTQQVTRIDDAFLLQKFSTLDKDGNIVNMPSAVDFVDGTEQVLIRFNNPNLSATPEGKALQKKDEKQGTHHFYRTIPIDKRAWLKVITGETFKGKDIGGINTIIEKVLNANGNSLRKVIEKGNAPTPAPSTKGKSKIVGIPEGGLN